MVRNYLKCLAITASLASSPAIAAKGKVVAVCRSLFVISTGNGYSLVDWYGGASPSKGDTVVGDFESYGMKELFNLRADDDMRVYVNEYWLSEDRAKEKYREKCN